jgi:hypothetical protein
MFPPSRRPLAIALLVAAVFFMENLDEENRFCPGGTKACSLDIWRGALEVIYAPKVAAGLSPGFQPWEPSKQRVRPERARG